MKTIILCLAVAMTVSAHAIEMLLDERMAAKAEVVLRVKLLNPPQGNDKYSWFRVQVLEVLKNTSDEMFKDTCSVAAYSGKKGVPAGESTIYLERYNKATHQLWMLVGGEASTGVSHSSVR